MIIVRKHGVVLEPTDRPFENRSVLNPAIWQQGKTIHMVYRAINQDFMSAFGYARLQSPTKIAERLSEPFWRAQAKYEKKGVEDPRLTQIGDKLYMIYVAHDGKNANLAYASGPDLWHLERGGLIGARVSYQRAGRMFSKNPKLKDDYLFFASFYKEYDSPDVQIWQKDGALFGEKFRGHFALVQRILPDIQIVLFKDFAKLKTAAFWKDYLQRLDKYVMLENKYGFEERHLGGGPPPIKTKDGWLLIYHGVEEQNKGRIYRAGVALFDLKNPRKLLARLPYPLFEPDRDYELRGEVDDVVFPTGTAQLGDHLYIYYGASDRHIAVASVSLKRLLAELSKYRLKK